MIGKSQGIDAEILSLLGSGNGDRHPGRLYVQGPAGKKPDHLRSADEVRLVACPHDSPRFFHTFQSPRLSQVIDKAHRPCMALGTVPGFFTHPKASGWS